jgi:hypothetical protein
MYFKIALCLVLSWNGFCPDSPHSGIKNIIIEMIIRIMEMLSPHHLNKYHEKYMSGSNSYVANRSTQETRVTTKQIYLIGIFFLLPGNGPSRVFLASNSRLETGKKRI